MLRPGDLPTDWTFHPILPDTADELRNPATCGGWGPPRNLVVLNRDLAYRLDVSGHEAGHMYVRVALGPSPEQAQSDFDRIGSDPHYPGCTRQDVEDNLTSNTPGFAILGGSVSPLNLSLPLHGDSYRVLTKYQIGTTPAGTMYTDEITMLSGRIKVEVDFQRCCSIAWDQAFENPVIDLLAGRMQHPQP
jgi:hypothetical protein